MECGNCHGNCDRCINEALTTITLRIAEARIAEAQDAILANI